MKTERAIRGHLHLVDGTELWVAHGRRLYAGESPESLRLHAELPIGWFPRLLASMRLSRRALRLDIHQVARLDDRLVVAGFGRLWCLDAQSGRLLGTPTALVGGRPLTLCANSAGIFYGEYRDNPERAPVRILFSADGIEWTAVRELVGVRHIHGIYQDPYSTDLWVTTGDEGEECAIWRSADSFASIERVHFGSQQVRAIPLLFTAEHIYYGTDTPLEENYLYRFERGGAKLQRLHAVEGSVFHAARVGEWLFFSTAVEPSEVNRSRDAVVYGSRDGSQWREIARHRKDAFDLRYFQYGQLMFPAGENRTGFLWYNTFATKPDFLAFRGELDVD